MNDRLGDYRAGFTVLAALAALGSIFWILATPPRPPRASPASRDLAHARLSAAADG